MERKQRKIRSGKWGQIRNSCKVAGEENKEKAAGKFNKTYEICGKVEA